MNNDTHTSPVSRDTQADTTPPQLLRIRNGLLIMHPAAAIGEVFDVELQFSEPVTGLTVAHLTVPNGTLSDLRSRGGGQIWNARLTPTANIVAETNAISVVNLDGVRDAAGNNATLARDFSSENYIIDTERPVLNGATVNRNRLVLSYTEASSFGLETNQKATPDAFTVLVGNTANAVIIVTVNAVAKTVTLTLARPVGHGDTVTVSYADPTTGDDSRATQDAVGNDAASFTAQPVRNDTPAGTGPMLSSAAVNGNQLVLNYTAANPLDAAHTAVGANFEVNVDGAANAVTAVTVDAVAKTVTLTLTRAVEYGATVSVSYTDPSANDDANATQDQQGNDAGSFSAWSVSNNMAPDATAPRLLSIEIDNTVLKIGSRPVITFTFSEAVDGFSLRNLIVPNGYITSLMRIPDDSRIWIGRLRPSSGVTADGNTIIVRNLIGVRNEAGQTAALANDFTNPSYIVDSVRPVFERATVSGEQLVLYYTEASTLDATNKAPPGAFSVLIGNAATLVTTVTVNAVAKTVTLTLSRAVAHGDVVTVAYTDPTTPVSNNPATGDDINATQDAVGNDAASFTARPVENETPDTAVPVLASATVNGNQLVLSYTDTSTLDAGNKADPNAFTVRVNGNANAVTAVTVDATAKTVTLTLATAAVYGDVVAVTYTDPTANNDANATQDAAGNDAVSFTARPVENRTTDIAAPVFASATVHGDQLVLSYTDTSPLDERNKADPNAFTVRVNGSANIVTTVTVDATAKTVLLTLARAVAHGDVVSVSYTDPTDDDDVSATQDIAGNDVGSLTPHGVTNETPDTMAPVLESATVNGTRLVLRYTDTSPLDAYNIAAPNAFTVRANGSANAVTTVTVDAVAKTVTLTLTRAVAHGDRVSVTYTDPTGRNDVNATQDVAGNDAASLMAQVVENETRDTVAPVFESATVNGIQLVLRYTDTSLLDARNKAAPDAFTVHVNGSANAVTAVTVDAMARTVKLTLTTAVAYGDRVTVAYTDPTAGNDANATQDIVGNDATSLTARTVGNVTRNTTAPVLESAEVNASELVLRYTDTFPLDATHKAEPSAFMVRVNGSANAVTAVTVDAIAGTVKLTLTAAVVHGDSVTVAYTDPTAGDDVNATQDASGNEAASFTARDVENETPDTDAPRLMNILIERNTLRRGEMTTVKFIFSEEVFGLTAGNVAVENGRLTNLRRQIDKPIWLADLTPNDVATAHNNIIRVRNLVGVQDLAGNTAAEPTSSIQAVYSIDTTLPQLAPDGITIIYSDTADTTLRQGETATVRITFTEAVEGVENAVSASHGTLSAPTRSTDGRTWTFTLTPAANTTARDNEITLEMFQVTDLAGNSGEAPADAPGALDGIVSSSNYSVDTVRPALASAMVNGRQLVLTYTEVTTLDAINKAAPNAFTVRTNANANANAVTTVTVNTAAKTVTLTLSSAVAHGDTVSVSYADPTTGDDTSATQDAAGNDAASFTNSPVRNETPDTTPPELAATGHMIDHTLVGPGQPGIVTIQFSEAVKGFGTEDVILEPGGGSVSEVTAVNPGAGGRSDTWRVTIQAPARGVAAKNDDSVRVNLRGVIDVAGNAGVRTATVPGIRYDVDNIPPTATITLSDYRLAAGETAEVTVQFSERVTGFNLSQILADDGSLSNLRTSADGLTWTATLTPTATGEQGTDFHIWMGTNYGAVCDLVGNALWPFARSAVYTLDRVTPQLAASGHTISHTALGPVQPTTSVTIKFSEAVKEFGTDDVTLATGGGSVSAVTAVSPGADGSSDTWQVTIAGGTGTAASNGITVNLAGVRDIAGNAGVDTVTVPGLSYSIDNTVPTASITLS
ncbi:SwmB domain-containing protein, partial [Verminephrobacter aporrectodeae]